MNESLLQALGSLVFLIGLVVCWKINDRMNYDGETSRRTMRCYRKIVFWSGRGVLILMGLMGVIAFLIIFMTGIDQ